GPADPGLTYDAYVQEERGFFAAGPNPYFPTFAPFPDGLADEVLAIFPGTVDLAGDSVLLDSHNFYACPSRSLGKLVDATGAPVLQFVFADHVHDPASHLAASGAYHTLEGFYAFGTLPARGDAAVTPEEWALSEAMMGYWTRFIATGDPNGA